MGFLLGIHYKSDAVTVRFDDADRGSEPDKTLEINGVTVSGYVTWGFGWDPEWHLGDPVTILGVGLGSAKVGPSTSLTMQRHFDAGNQSYASDWVTREGLHLSVDGYITEIAAEFKVSVLQTGEALNSGFGFYMYYKEDYGHYPPHWLHASTPVPGPVTIINQNAPLDSRSISALA